jgi:hypothetical protein
MTNDVTELSESKAASNGWTAEVLKEELAHGRLTIFCKPNKKASFFHCIPCHWCYQWFPRVNVLQCCKRAICSYCLVNNYLFPLSDSHCFRCQHQITGIVTNVSHENCQKEVRLDDDQEWPEPVILTEHLKGTIRQIAAEYNLDLEAVEELISENRVLGPILELLKPEERKEAS